MARLVCKIAKTRFHSTFAARPPYPSFDLSLCQPWRVFTRVVGTCCARAVLGCRIDLCCFQTRAKPSKCAMSLKKIRTCAIGFLRTSSLFM
jgi:hypothetical protein